MKILISQPMKRKKLWKCWLKRMGYILLKDGRMQEDAKEYGVEILY